MSKLYKSQSSINGSGLFTSKKIKKGVLVDYIHGPIVQVRKFTPALSLRSLNWIGVGRYTWIDTKKSMFNYINHSCNPNTAIVTKRKVIALSDISVDQEITMDYSLTEADSGWSIECRCGEKNCRKKIEPIYSLPKNVFSRYLPHIPSNFKKIYYKSHIS